MKKIAISLGIIGVVAAIVIGATTAYFSDTETSVGNTFSAGTIDIDIDGQNPWTSNYDVGDLKPGEVGYINFRINNVGQNPVNVSKTLKNIVGNGGAVQQYNCEGNIGMVSSEPECVAETKLTQRVDDVQTQIVYDLSVEVYSAEGLLWWQTIYSEKEGQSIANVYGSGGGNYVDLGMIPVDGYMMVTQSYHFDANAGNEYQGDGLTFDIEIKGDQLMQEGGATVTLENKSGDPDWNIIEDDQTQGVLTYQTKGSTFDYSFSGTGLQNINYSLIYYADPWPGDNPGALIASGTASSGSLNLIGSYDFRYDLPHSDDSNAPEGAKIWLVPSSDYDSGSNSLTEWNPSNYLFETSLIIYDDTDL